MLILSGAGIGVPLGLPTTTGFSNSLESSDADVGFLSHLDSFLGKSRNDIEHILSALQTFAQEDTDLTFHIIRFQDTLLSKDLKNQGTSLRRGLPKNTSDYISGLKRKAARSSTAIKKLIYRRLTEFNEKDAHRLYRQLFKELMDNFGNWAISYFTTNYDLSFETALDAEPVEWEELGIKGVETGFSNKGGKTLYDAKLDFNWNAEQIEYRKLHGSLDWHRGRGNTCIKSGATITPDNPDEMFLIYPGYKTIPENPPFDSLHNRLFQRLREADLVIVVGFAFRDPYINYFFSALLSANHKVNIHCFNPLPADKHPQDSKIPYFCKFNNFQYHQVGIEDTENPLNIATWLKNPY